MYVCTRGRLCRAVYPRGACARAWARVCGGARYAASRFRLTRELGRKRRRACRCIRARGMRGGPPRTQHMRRPPRLRASLLACVLACMRACMPCMHACVRACVRRRWRATACAARMYVCVCMCVCMGVRICVCRYMCMVGGACTCGSTVGRVEPVQRGLGDGPKARAVRPVVYIVNS